MLDWMNRKTNKSKEELEYDRLAKEYFEKFGVTWKEKVGFSRSMDETLKEMAKCIKTNEKQKLNDYENGMEY